MEINKLPIAGDQLENAKIQFVGLISGFISKKKDFPDDEAVRRGLCRNLENGLQMGECGISFLRHENIEGSYYIGAGLGHNVRFRPGGRTLYLDGRNSELCGEKGKQMIASILEKTLVQLRLYIRKGQLKLYARKVREDVKSGQKESYIKDIENDARNFLDLLEYERKVRYFPSNAYLHSLYFERRKGPWEEDVSIETWLEKMQLSVRTVKNSGYTIGRSFAALLHFTIDMLFADIEKQKSVIETRSYFSKLFDRIFPTEPDLPYAEFYVRKERLLSLLRTIEAAVAAIEDPKMTDKSVSNMYLDALVREADPNMMNYVYPCTDPQPAAA